MKHRQMFLYLCNFPEQFFEHLVAFSVFSPLGKAAELALCHKERTKKQQRFRQKPPGLLMLVSAAFPSAPRVNVCWALPW